MRTVVECPYCKHPNNYLVMFDNSEPIKKNCNNPLCFRDFVIEVNLVTSATARKIDFAEAKEGNEKNGY